MAAPKVVSVAPVDGAIGISLGTKITVTFDQVVDAATLSAQTFLLTGPGTSSLVFVPGPIPVCRLSPPS